MTEAIIRRQVQSWAQAIGARDIEGVMSVYSAALVSFDLDPPLRYSGNDLKRRAWENFFAVYPSRVLYDVTELSVSVDAGLAFAHSLNHVRGELVDGSTKDIWVRWTACFRHQNGAWLITHDHASVPVDVAGGRARLDLEP